MFIRMIFLKDTIVKPTFMTFSKKISDDQSIEVDHSLAGVHLFIRYPSTTFMR